MQVTQFLKEIDKHLDRRLFLICGEEDYLRKTALDRLLSKLPCGSLDLNCNFLSPKADLKALRDLAEQIPCFAECRIVVLEDSELLEKGDGKAVCDYLDVSSDMTKIIFVCKKAPDARRALSKYLDKNALRIEAGSLSEMDLLRWVGTSARRRKLELSRENAQLLCDISGEEMSTLLHELDKLAALGKPRVEREDILALASHTTQYDAFAFHGLMMQKRVEEAFAILREIQKRRDDIMSFLGLIASKFSPMAMAKYCLYCGMTDCAAAEELIKQQKMKKYPAEIAVRESKRFSMAHLQRAVRLLEAYDLAVKSGGSDMGVEAVLLRVYDLT
ncbi:MAG: DNA polymerase III subunit delta [Christensenellaceae bacterium]|nr:DNA polymerase III subunit delta [Christensenellaceae bacterium]